MNSFQIANGGFRSRMSHYSPIGDGRDTYIAFNNGGNWVRNNTDPFESAQYFHTPKPFSKKPSIPAKKVHYPPDGSGRDVFIKFDEGGTLNVIPTSPQSRNYITSLRTYSKSTYGLSPKIPDFFTESQHVLPLKDYIRASQQSRKQRRLVERLLESPQHKLPFIQESRERKQNLSLPKLKR